MAKKKTSNVQGEKPLQKPESTVNANQQVTPAMESEGSEKIDQLKSLNQMLLKETVERRLQVESLVQEKDSLAMELARSKLERDELKSELTQLGESVARMELERGVVTDFVAVQVGLKEEDVGRRMKDLEMGNLVLKSEIGEKEREIARLSGKLSNVEGFLENEGENLRRLSVERDGLKSQLDLKINEIKRLKGALSELEEGKGEMFQRLEDLGDAYNHVVGEKEALEMRIESIIREKDFLASSLEGVNKLKEELNAELSRVVREKEAIEEEKNVEMVKREGLESAVSGLNKMVAGLQKEEEKLRGIVAELEKQNNEGEERQKDLRREINQLVEVKEMNERKVEGLLVEKTMMEKELGNAMTKLDEQKVKIEELINENTVLVEAKIQLEGEVGGLHSQMAEVRSIVSGLEECNHIEAQKIKSLECKLEKYSCKLELVKSERDEMNNRVHEEKKNSEALKGVIEELETKIKESSKAVEKARADNAAILAVKSELESKHKMLSQKIASLGSNLTDARNAYDSMKGKAELADTISEQVLNMLKGTVAFCLEDENDREGSEMDGVHKCADGEEAMKYVSELEMIKNAFKTKASKVDSLRRELEFLQNSVEDAHKRKGFWTMLSSATTVLAAVSIAYIARGH